MSTEQDKREQRLRLLDDHIGAHLRDSERSGERQAAPSCDKPLAFGDGSERRDLQRQLSDKRQATALRLEHISASGSW